MAHQARVTSIEALAIFRAQLIVYLEKATCAVDDVSDDVIRTRVWLQNDQRMHWEAQIRQRTRALETAQQELFSARLSGLREATAAQQLGVAKAKRVLAEAQAKLGVLKRWNRRYDSEAGPLAKQVERLRDLLASDMRKAVAFLAQAVNALEAYADRAPVITASVSPAHSEQTNRGDIAVDAPAPPGLPAGAGEPGAKGEGEP
jgi:hypothetical protein